MANYECHEKAERYLQYGGEIYLGKIDYDPDAKQYKLESRSLLELPGGSPAALCIKEILVNAGYKVQQ
ncbi:MAG: hypothetical protein R6V59_00320 [Dehalococcoidia bacterium]